VGPSILFLVFPLFWLLWFLFDWHGFIIIISKHWLAYLLRLQSVGYFVSVTPFDDYWVTVCLLSTICADFACWFPAGVQLGFTMFVKLLVAKDSY
jgi:hypothetical protein